MKDYADFLDDVMPEIPGADQGIIVHEIARTVRDFCQGSWLHNATQTIAAAIDTPNYAITIPAGHVVADVLFVDVDGIPIDPLTEFVLDASEPGWRTYPSGEVFGYLLSADKATLTLVRTPDAVHQCSVRVAFKPSKAATQCQDFILEQHSEAIAAGAKSRLMAMPKKPWSNPQLAAVWQGRYESAKAKAREAAQMSNTIAQPTLVTLLEC